MDVDYDDEVAEDHGHPANKATGLLLVTVVVVVVVADQPQQQRPQEEEEQGIGSCSRSWHWQ